MEFFFVNVRVCVLTAQAKLKNYHVSSRGLKQRRRIIESY